MFNKVQRVQNVWWVNLEERRDGGSLVKKNESTDNYETESMHAKMMIVATDSMIFKTVDSD